MVDVTLRPVEPGDLEYLATLYAATRRAELAPVPWPEAAKRDFLAQQFTLQDAHYRQHYPGAELSVIVRDGRAIGRFYVHRTAHEMRLMDIIVDEAERGQGIATRLIQSLVDEARETKRSVTLHVEPDNPVQRIYARFGFRLIEERGVYQFLGFDPSAA